MMKPILRVGALLPLLVLAAASQESLVRQLKQDVATAKIMGIMGAVMGPAVKDAPYSGLEIRENTQVLADGNRIDQATRTMVYRDSQGRIRRETPEQITIWDPVAGAGYLLDPRTQTARKMPLALGVAAGKNVVRFGFRTASPDGPPFPPPPGAETLAFTAAGGGPGRQLVFFQGKQQNLSSNSESLGQQNLDGVNAQGTRVTSTIEAGAIGNERPIQIVSETWYSPDLQTMVKSVHSDPRMGQDTFELTNIDRAEPGPDLFQVPAGYQIVDPK